MSDILLRGNWCINIALNVRVRSEQKSDDINESFYWDLEQFFNNFPKYQLKILLGDINVKLKRENIFNPTIQNESIHQDSSDNGVRKVNFATSENPVVKSKMLPHRKIHK